MPRSSKKSTHRTREALPEFEFDMATADLVGDFLDEINRVLALEATRDGMNKAKLADRMDRDKSIVTKILSGHRNLTFQTAARVIRALDHEAKITLEPLYTARGDNRPTYHEVHGLVRRPLDVITTTSTTTTTAGTSSSMQTATAARSSSDVAVIE